MLHNIEEPLMPDTATTTVRFDELGLAPFILPTLAAKGYTSPTRVQAESIPPLLKGRNVLVRSQTGTGKTAAFALPILSKIDVDNRSPQALILTPTRELAQQVAANFKTYAGGLKKLNIATIYGGQDFKIQLDALKRGPQIIVATPGRMMDHLERKKVSLENINTLVLDEADEMLNMGFLEDVEWILNKIPGNPQTALFSATLPNSIKNIIKKYLSDPVKVEIQEKTQTVENIKQHIMLVSQKQKFEALSRYLELTEFEGVIIFTRTKIISSEVADKLMAAGYKAAALNGDMNQTQRNHVIEKIKLKQRKIDIIVATDVAARGLDVECLSHVINYDMPFNPETYVHRIGRTGRAGRTGTAVLLATPNERKMLKLIEAKTRANIQDMPIPSHSAIRERRIKRVGERMQHILENKNLSTHREIVENLMNTHENELLDIAAALLFMGKHIPAPQADIVAPSFSAESDKRHRRKREFSNREYGPRDHKRPAKREFGNRDSAHKKPAKRRVKRRDG